MNSPWVFLVYFCPLKLKSYWCIVLVLIYLLRAFFFINLILLLFLISFFLLFLQRSFKKLGYINPHRWSGLGSFQIKFSVKNQNSNESSSTDDKKVPLKLHKSLSEFEENITKRGRIVYRKQASVLKITLTTNDRLNMANKKCNHTPQRF